MQSHRAHGQATCFGLSAYTMQSGADSALLYDTLREHDKEGQYKRIEGRAVGARLILVACCSVLAGLLATIDLRLALYIGCRLRLYRWWLRSNLRSHDQQIDTLRKQIAILKQGTSFVLGSKEVRWMVGFAALLATTSKVWFLHIQPVLQAGWASHRLLWRCILLPQRSCVAFEPLCLSIEK